MPEKYPTRYFPYKVTIEQLAGTQDATGAELQTWNSFTTAWVSIEQLGGTERVVAQQIFAEASTRLWMKFQPGILPKMRVTYTDGGSVTRHFDILSVADPDGRRRFLQLLCTERVESGS